MNVKDTHNVIIFFMLFYTSFHCILHSHAQDKSIRQMRDVEKLPLKNIANKEWYIIEVSPEFQSGEGREPGAYLTKDKGIKSDGATGPLSQISLGYWEVQYTSIDQNRTIDGGKYHWWKPVDVAGNHKKHDPFIAGGKIISWANFSKEYTLPKWRNAENIRKIERSNLENITLPKRIETKKTIYTKKSFAPFFLIPDEREKDIVEAANNLRTNNDIISEEISREDVERAENSFISCKLFQQFIKQNRSSFTESASLIPETRNFVGKYFTYVLFKQYYTNNENLKRILHYIKNSENKPVFINNTYAMYSLVDHERGGKIRSDEWKTTLKMILKELINKQKSVEIKESGYQNILEFFKKRFPDIRPGSSK